MRGCYVDAVRFADCPSVKAVIPFALCIGFYVQSFSELDWFSDQYLVLMHFSNRKKKLLRGTNFALQP